MRTFHPRQGNTDHSTRRVANCTVSLRHFSSFGWNCNNIRKKCCLNQFHMRNWLICPAEFHVSAVGLRGKLLAHPASRCRRVYVLHIFNFIHHIGRKKIHTYIHRLIIRLEAMHQSNIGFTLRGKLAVITRSAITPPKVNWFGWNLAHFECIVGGWPRQILGAIRAVARVWQGGEI